MSRSELLLGRGICDDHAAALAKHQHAVRRIVEDRSEHGIVLALGLRVGGLEFLLHQGRGAIVQPTFAIELGIGLIDDRAEGVEIDLFAVALRGRSQLTKEELMHQLSRQTR